MNVKPGDIVLVPMKITDMYLPNTMVDAVNYKLKPIVGEVGVTGLTLTEDELAKCEPRVVSIPTVTTASSSGDTDDPGVVINVGGGEFIPEFDKPLHEPECCKNCPNRNNQFCHCVLPYLSSGTTGDITTAQQYTTHTNISTS